MRPNTAPPRKVWLSRDEIQRVLPRKSFFSCHDNKLRKARLESGDLAAFSNKSNPWLPMPSDVTSSRTAVTSLRFTAADETNRTRSAVQTTSSDTNRTGSAVKTTSSDTNRTGSTVQTTSSDTNRTGSAAQTTSSDTNRTGSAAKTTPSETNRTESAVKTTSSDTNRTGSGAKTTSSETNRTGSAVKTSSSHQVSKDTTCSRPTGDSKTTNKKTNWDLVKNKTISRKKSDHLDTSGQSHSNVLHDNSELFLHDCKPLFEYLKFVTYGSVPPSSQTQHMFASAAAKSTESYIVTASYDVCARRSYLVGSRHHPEVAHEKHRKSHPEDKKSLKSQDVNEADDISEIDRLRLKAKLWAESVSTSTLIRSRIKCLQALGEDDTSITTWWTSLQTCTYLR